MGIRQRLLGVFGMIAVLGAICVLGLFHWQTKMHTQEFAAMQLRLQRSSMESRLQEFLQPARQTATALQTEQGDASVSWRNGALRCMEAFPSVAAIRVVTLDEGELTFFRGAGIYHLGRFKGDVQQWIHVNAQGEESLPPSHWMADSWIPKDYQAKQQPWSVLLHTDQDGLRWAAQPNPLTPGATASLPVGILFSEGDIKVLTVVHLFVDAFPSAPAETSSETEGTALVFSAQDLWFPDGEPSQEDVALMRAMLGESADADGNRSLRLASNSWRKWWLDGSSVPQRSLPFGLAAMHSHDSLRQHMVGSPALLLLLAVVALLVAIALPWWIIHLYNQPIEALTDRMYDVEHLSSAKDDWPESNVPEIQKLAHAAKEMCRHWEQRIRGLSKVETIEPVAGEAQSHRVSTLAREFMNTLQHERSDVPPVEEDVVLMPGEPSTPQGMPELVPGEALSQPPTAFVQAMQSTRQHPQHFALRKKALLV